MARKKPHLLADVLREIEATAKRIRGDLVRFRRDAEVRTMLTRLATDLRDGAVHVADQIERSLREVRAEVGKTAKKVRQSSVKRKGGGTRRVAKKPAARKRATAKTRAATSG